MHTIRIPAYAPIAFPVRPPPPRIVEPSSTQQAITIIGAVVGVGMYVVSSVIGVASIVLRDADLSAVSAPGVPTTPPAPPSPAAAPADLFVEHDGDDCAAAALRASHRCEDIQSFTAASAELRSCLAQPEHEARLCGEIPDPSNASATAQWIDTRCSFEDRRDYSDCVRLMSVVSDHCAVVVAEPKH